MFTLLALPLEAFQKWFDSRSISELLVLVGVIVISIAMGLREMIEHRNAGGFDRK